MGQKDEATNIKKKLLTLCLSLKIKKILKANLCFFNLHTPMSPFVYPDALRDNIRIRETQSTCPPGTF